MMQPDRSLDAFYDEGVSKIYAGLALKVTDYLGLDCKSMNMDTTSFHTDGQYEQDIDAQCIKITKGYSRDHRPELNKVVLNLLTENQALASHYYTCKPVVAMQMIWKHSNNWLNLIYQV